jgi:hypothetical protein
MAKPRPPSAAAALRTLTDGRIAAYDRDFDVESGRLQDLHGDGHLPVVGGVRRVRGPRTGVEPHPTSPSTCARKSFVSAAVLSPGRAPAGSGLAKPGIGRSTLLMEGSALMPLGV